MWLQVLGLHGIGGIGKTTLAKAVYNHLYLQFGSRHIFLSVGQDSADEHIMALQSRLHAELCGKEHRFCSTDEGKERLRSALPVGSKVLIVLDNLWSRKERDALLPDILPQGSIVIMTARDKSLLSYCGLTESERPAVSGLLEKEATKLLCLHAFPQPMPTEGFERLVKEVVEGLGFRV